MLFMNCFCYEDVGKEADFTSRCLSFCIDRLSLILTDLQQYFCLLFLVGWVRRTKNECKNDFGSNASIFLCLWGKLQLFLKWSCDVLSQWYLYSSRSASSERMLWCLLIHSNCIYPEGFLVIIIRLHFSLKDDEGNNQIILDLAVYRSDLFSLNFCHSEVSIHSVQLYSSL